MKALIEFIVLWIFGSLIVSMVIGPFAYLVTVFPYELFVNDFFGDWVYNPYVWEARVDMAFLILWGIGTAVGTAAMFLVCRERWLEKR